MHPYYQGQGFGKEILKQVMAFIENHAEKGTYVSLIADYPVINYIRSLDFNLPSPNLVECLKILKRDEIKCLLSSLCYI